MIEVTCAIIEKGGRILAAKRAHGMHLEGLWEFPGGKIERGETAEECIIREIREELNLHIIIRDKLNAVEHHYPEKSIRLIPFVCESESKNIVLSDHSDCRWFGKDDIHQVEWAAADMVVLNRYFGGQEI